jgi:hypothetical protein
MTGLALALVVAQLLDLATFLAIMPLVGPYGVEQGPIGTVHLTLGPLGSLAVKASGTALILAAAELGRGRYPQLAIAVLVLATVGATVGALSNSVATWQVMSALVGR